MVTEEPAVGVAGKKSVITGGVYEVRMSPSAMKSEWAPPAETL